MYFPPCGIRTCTRGRPEQTPRVPEREHSLNIIAQYFYHLRRALSYAPDSQRTLTFLYASIGVCFLIEHPRANGRFSPPSSCDDTALFPSTGAYIARYHCFNIVMSYFLHRYTNEFLRKLDGAILCNISED